MENSVLSRINKLAVTVVLVLLTGCSSVQYYGQSIIGHSRLMLARQPLEKAIKEADPKLQAKLRLAKKLRQYAVEELGLPDNGSYSSYVDLKREFPVWTVVAAPEFSIEAINWCYPIIGCASYRGFFSEQGATQFAESLRVKKLETSVGGAAAYSTLGWFDDPILPSMLRFGEANLAETLFHELAHQILYIKDDTAFNEAFATVVGEQGASRWLSRYRPDLMEDYRQRLAARNDFTELLDGVKQQLQDLYISKISNDRMRKSKRKILADVEAEYNLLKTQQWQGLNWFDGWFSTPVNNARLAAFATYRDQLPELIALLKSCDTDFTKFYASVRHIESNSVIPLGCLDF